jgi:hypothetical protein
MPVQVWATWFSRDGKPQSFIQGFPLEGLELSSRGQSPFRLRSGNNEIGEDSCCGALNVDGHAISWDLHYRSTLSVMLSHKGWIGFSCSPHSDAVFSGRVTLDGREFRSAPLGFGLQGHNCGYRHRGFWRWAHAYFAQPNGDVSTLEALVYDMPLGLRFCKAVLWHEDKQYVLTNLNERFEPSRFGWNFRAAGKDGLEMEATFDGSGPSLHHLPYVKTDCSGRFEVRNNSLAKAILHLKRLGKTDETLQTSSGAVLEMGGP